MGYLIIMVLLYYYYYHYNYHHTTTITTTTAGPTYINTIVTISTPPTLPERWLGGTALPLTWPNRWIAGLSGAEWPAQSDYLLVSGSLMVAAAARTPATQRTHLLTTTTHPSHLPLIHKHLPFPPHLPHFDHSPITLATHPSPT